MRYPSCWYLCLHIVIDVIFFLLLYNSGSDAHIGIPMIRSLYVVLCSFEQHQFKDIAPKQLSECDASIGG